jgi:hypothetical protein
MTACFLPTQTPKFTVAFAQGPPLGHSKAPTTSIERNQPIVAGPGRDVFHFVALAHCKVRDRRRQNCHLRYFFRCQAEALSRLARWGGIGMLSPGSNAIREMTGQSFPVSGSVAPLELGVSAAIRVAVFGGAMELLVIVIAILIVIATA